MEAVPGLKEYLSTWVENWGKDGLLTSKGMIASTPEAAARNAEVATNLTTIQATDLQ